MTARWGRDELWGLDIREVNLWGFVLLGLVGVVVLATGPSRRAHQLTALYMLGYAGWSAAFFLPAGLRDPLGPAGAIAGALGGGAAFLLAARHPATLPAASRRDLVMAGAAAVVALAFAEVSVWRTYSSVATFTPSLRTTIALWVGYMPFVAGVAGALVLLALRLRRAEALAARSWWLVGGIAGLAGLVGGRYWLAGPPDAPLYLGIAVAYTIGIGAVALLWIGARGWRAGRAVGLLSLVLLLAGMLLYTILGGVGDEPGALANHAVRLVTYAAMATSLRR